MMAILIPILKFFRWLFLPLIRSQVEVTGKQNPPKEPQFTEDQVITPPRSFKIGWFSAEFLYLYPNMAAVLFTHTGNPILPARGGFMADLDVGTYTLQYIDLRERRKVMRNIQDTSSEGAQVAMTIVITYQVKDARRLLGMERPLDIFFTACTAAIKGFIRSHAHDDLVCVQDSTLIADADIIRHIQQQVNQNPSCRAFTILDIGILERLGDPKIVEIQRGRVLQGQQTLSEQESLRQKEKITDQKESLLLREGEMERQKVMLEQHVEELRALIKASLADVEHRIEFQKAELERLRQQPDRQHEYALKALEVRAEALHALTQMNLTPGFPRTQEESRTLEELLKKISDTPVPGSSPLAALTSSLEGLLPKD
jgi:hypothetical protein